MKRSLAILFLGIVTFGLTGFGSLDGQDAGSVAGKMTGLEDEVSRLNSRVSDLETEISRLKDEQSDYEKKISDLEGEVANLENRSSDHY